MSIEHEAEIAERADLEAELRAELSPEQWERVRNRASPGGTVAGAR